MDPEPVSVFDGTEGGLEPFHLIASMAFDSDDSFILGEMAMTRLRRYSLTDGFDRTIGFPGEGPGEFGAMNHIGIHHDSLVVFDSRWSRISIFDPDFAFARVFRLEASPGRGRFHGLFPDGRILGLATVPGRGRVWSLWDLEGRALGEVEGLPELPPLTLRSLGPSTAHGPREPMRPFRASRFGAVAGEWILWIDGGDYRFELFDLEKGFVASERLDLPARPLDAARREEFQREQLERFDPVPPDMRRSIEEAEFPETLPSLGNGSSVFGSTGAITDERGRIWVAEYPANAPQRWFVVDPEEGLIGDLRLPDGFELEAVRSDLLLGVARDAFEVQTAVVLRYREEAAGGG